MLLRNDYTYVMKFVVSTLVRVMYFPHNESIVIVDQLASFDPSPFSFGPEIAAGN